ncbi:MULTISPECIES: RidA family protein [unclassified Chelatococcus]|uniref:RidA family protein n=1 Tax=unclassified Chelatococcus TaxID=2638111 RepID=UPI001BCEF531|nr:MULTISPECIES: RidA family protein [unclassified Chelatococcus]CAH1671127.1 putative RutC family protein HD_0322 [Hyphomicrobiales bacterium]MBS7739117.1 RidA family protein [Chelatococcus sp. HY11]MBX3543552.1 RidA family protein [Chelatococcus sp.]MCO5076353.1 RidA family protein [Chelatococcus sp.]CAH1676679.1 putative RutC family protein HD_0322 [Hyphomicrobiales bacterium]
MLKRFHTGDLVSRMVSHNGVVHLSGLTSRDTKKGLADQTREVLERIEEALAEAGSDKSRILTATIWLADFKDKEEMNAIWRNWLPAGAAPARAAMEVELGEGILVEIMVQAACD